MNGLGQSEVYLNSRSFELDRAIVDRCLLALLWAIPALHVDTEAGLGHSTSADVLKIASIVTLQGGNGTADDLKDCVIDQTTATCYNHRILHPESIMANKQAFLRRSLLKVGTSKALELLTHGIPTSEWSGLYARSGVSRASDSVLFPFRSAPGHSAHIALVCLDV